MVRVSVHFGDFLKYAVTSSDHCMLQAVLTKRFQVGFYFDENVQVRSYLQLSVQVVHTTGYTRWKALVHSSSFSLSISGGREENASRKFAGNI